MTLAALFDGLCDLLNGESPIERHAVANSGGAPVAAYERGTVY